MNKLDYLQEKASHHMSRARELVSRDGSPIQVKVEGYRQTRMSHKHMDKFVKVMNAIESEKARLENVAEIERKRALIDTPEKIMVEIERLEAEKIQNAQAVKALKKNDFQPMRDLGYSDAQILEFQDYAGTVKFETPRLKLETINQRLKLLKSKLK